MFSPEDIKRATVGKVDLASMLETLGRVGKDRGDINKEVTGEDMTI